MARIRRKCNGSAENTTKQKTELKKAISLSAARTQLPELVEALKDGPVLLLHKGQPCAALVGLGEHFDREAFSLGRDKALRRLIDEACRRTKEDAGVPFSEILKAVNAQAPAEKKRPSRPRAKSRAAR